MLLGSPSDKSQDAANDDEHNACDRFVSLTKNTDQQELHAHVRQNESPDAKNDKSDAPAFH